MNQFIGIDGGLNGGIVIIDENQQVINKFVMPTLKSDNKTHYDAKRIVEIFKTLNEKENIKVILEKSHVRPISGKRASFMTGFGYGLMQGILESLGISYEIVKPQTWMKELEITSTDEKGSILFCQRKWPNEKWTATERCTIAHTGLTDAACLALYGFKINKLGG
jgi:hypothetical protein